MPEAASVRNTPAVRLRQATFDDHGGISALEASHGLKPKTFEEWSRLWTANPCYRQFGAEWPIGWVLEAKDGRVVGSVGNLPLPYVLDGRPVLVATGRGWAVEEQYRSFALMLMDEYFSQSKPEIFLNTTVNAQAAEAFGVFGSSRVPAGDWGTAAFFITGHRGFAESALRIKQLGHLRLLSYPTGFALSVKDGLTARRPPVLRDVRVEVARGFDERFDAFWNALSGASTALLAVRSREVLEWHFAASIERDELLVITASKGGAIEAYGIFQRRDEPQFGLKRMRMVDFQALANHAGLCSTIVARALDQCREQGIHALEHVGCGLDKVKSFDEYAPYRRQLPSWSFFYLARMNALARRLEAADSWSPSAFDGDSSL